MRIVRVGGPGDEGTLTLSVDEIPDAADGSVGHRADTVGRESVKRSDHTKRTRPSQEKQSVQRFGDAPQVVVGGLLVEGHQGVPKACEVRAQAAEGTQPLPPENTATVPPRQAPSPETSPSTPAAETERAPTPVTDPVRHWATVLEALIVEERLELLQVVGALRGLYDVLLYSDDDDGAFRADVALVCARLIKESAARLDTLIKRYRSGEFRSAWAASTSTAESDRSLTTQNRADDAEGRP